MLGFQDRSISAMMTLLGTSDAIRTYEGSLRDATGFTEDVAAKQMESFTAQLEQLKNQAINVGISLFDILKPRLEGLLKTVKKGIDWFEGLSDSQKKMLTNVGLITAAIGPLLYGLGMMVRTVASLRTGFIALNIATKGWLATISGFTAAGAAMYGMGEGVDRLSNKVDNLYGPLIRIIYPISEVIHQSKLYIEVFKGLKDGTLNWTDLLKMNRVQIENWADAHREGISMGLGMAEATAEMTDTAKEYNDMSVEQQAAFQDNEALLESLQEQYGFTREEAEEYAEAEGLLREETDDTTDSIDEQKQAVDDLRQEFNDLIDDVFGHITTYNDFEEAGWAVEEAEKAVAEAIAEHGENSIEAKRAINELDDANIEAIKTAFELSTSIKATTEEQEEARRKAVELGLQYIETKKIGVGEFWEMASEFGLSAGQIFAIADEMGIEIDHATRQRIIDIEAETAAAEADLHRVEKQADELDGKTVTINVGTNIGKLGWEGIDEELYRKLHGGAMGGLITPQGIMQSFASGGVVPQTGREVPILAHEGEMILNSSQQSNLIDALWGVANGKDTGTRDLSINFNEPVYIREDADIKKIGQEFAQKIKTVNAGVGIK